MASSFNRCSLNTLLGLWDSVLSRQPPQVLTRGQGDYIRRGDCIITPEGQSDDEWASREGGWS